jgi:hypothetical protein
MQDDTYRLHQAARKHSSHAELRRVRTYTLITGHGANRTISLACLPKRPFVS